MLPELQEEIELGLAMLRQHLEVCAPLRRAVSQHEPDRVEIMAVGAMLHSFYNGIENIFKRVAIHCDGGPPRGETWHQVLLGNMTMSTATRPAVISETLRAALNRYLDFRHFFRQAYGFQLNWSKM